MIQAFVNSIEFLDDSSARVLVTLTDGNVKTTRQFTVSSQSELKGQARFYASQLSNASDLKELTPGQELDLVIPPIPVPEPTEIQLFIASYNKLQSALRKITTGLIKEDDSDLLALKAETAKLYKSEFIGIG